MPCLFKTEVKNSGIHGKGFFALEDIPKGAVYWVWGDQEGAKKVVGYEEQENIILTKQDMFNKEKENKDEFIHILHGGFLYAATDMFVWLRDGTEFTNHSEDWNSQMVYDEEGTDFKKMACVARKEIKAGDEITGYYGNYLSTEAQWINELMQKYLPERKKIQNDVISQGNLALNWKV